MVKALIVSGCLVVFLITACIASCTYVDPGHVGVKINRTGGGVEKEPLPPGFHAYWPIASTIEEYPVAMRTVVYTKNATEGSVHNEEINVNSIEGQPISCDVSLSFDLDASLVPMLYQTFRKSIDAIAHDFVRQTIRQSLQEVVGRRHVADVLGRDKAVVVVETTEKLKGRLAKYGIRIQQFTLNEVRAPESIVKAIESKNAMEQESLRAQNEKQKRQFEADQQIIQAKASAEATLLQAKAQAEANQLLSQSLTTTLVNYRALEKWDGKLPQFSSGAVPFVQMTPAAVQPAGK